MRTCVPLFVWCIVTAACGDSPSATTSESQPVTPTNASTISTSGAGSTARAPDASAPSAGRPTAGVSKTGALGGMMATGGVPASSQAASAGMSAQSAPAAGAGAAGAGGLAAGQAGISGMGSVAAGRGAAGEAGAAGGTQHGETVCPSQKLPPGDSTRMLQVDSKMRSYVLHVPSTYDGSKAAPLVVDFHPLGGSGMQERQGSPYPAVTDPEGVVMAFPSGLSGPSGGAWNVGGCCVADVDDVAFAKALVSDVEKLACVDPKRVYAVGFSMGGGMSHYLACHAADVFAAVAPAAFDLLKENIDDCKPPRPITVVSFRGTMDPIVPYEGGPSAVVSGMPITFLGAMGTLQAWAKINMCPGSASAPDANNCQSYSGCAGAVDLMLCTKNGGSHEPGDAKVAWPILSRHVLP